MCYFILKLKDFHRQIHIYNVIALFNHMSFHSVLLAANRIQLHQKLFVFVVNSEYVHSKLYTTYYTHSKLYTTYYTHTHTHNLPYQALQLGQTWEMMDRTSLVISFLLEGVTLVGIHAHMHILSSNGTT